MALRREEILEIIESGLLEAYALGLTDAQESDRVSTALEESEELREEYNSIQDGFESLAMAGAMKAPADLKGSIMAAIESEDSRTGAGLTVAKAPTSENKAAPTATIKRMNRMVVAASVAAFLFAAVAISEWMRATEFEQQNAMLVQQMDLLRRELGGEQQKFATLQRDVDAINDPGAAKFILFGNDKAPQFAAVAYWNEEDQSSYLRVDKHPELENDEVLQLWADVHGEMVSLGVIENTTDIVALDFKVDAESLNVTIEPAGGSEHPTVSRLVASIAI